MPRKKINIKKTDKPRRGQSDALHCDIHPIGDWVAIVPDEAEQSLACGLILPDIAKKLPTRGVVLDVGPGRSRDNNGGEPRLPMHVRVGDRVVFEQYSGKHIKVKGIDARLVREENILAVIEVCDAA